MQATCNKFPRTFSATAPAPAPTTTTPTSHNGRQKRKIIILKICICNRAAAATVAAVNPVLFSGTFHWAPLWQLMPWILRIIRVVIAWGTGRKRKQINKIISGQKCRYNANKCCLRNVPPNCWHNNYRYKFRNTNKDIKEEDTDALVEIRLNCS